MSVLILRSSAASVSLASDWLLRSTGTDVVWAHDFQTEDEVDNFRVSGGIGNDPSNTGATDCIWVPQGLTGGALQFTIPGDGVEISHGLWRRPFSALSAGGNGLAFDDRAAGGAVTAPRTWNPANANQCGTWGAGYVGNSVHRSDAVRGHNGSNGFEWETHTGFWFQAVMRVSSGRFTPGTPDGKLIMVLITGDGPLVGTGQPRTPNQEIVIKSEPALTCYMYTNFGNRSNSFLHANQGSSNDGSAQPGGVNAATCFARGDGSPDCTTYPAGSYFALLFHLIPGTDGGNGNDPIMAGNPNNNTTLQVWIAPQGATSYTKWYDKTDIVLSYGADDPWPQAFNCLELNGFMNQVPSSTAWTQQCAQLVYSRASIPCPQVWP
jgi:hypothetical protein